MSWLLAGGPVLLLTLVGFGLVYRRFELQTYARHHRERTNARVRGSDKARLQHPDIDLSRCIGCGSCVRACPEEGVLALMHGQAVVVHGARCVGHGLCAAACPTGGIALTLGDLSERRDLPALHENLEAVGVPGLFLAGELSGFALVRTAVTQGVAVADAVAARLESEAPRERNGRGMNGDGQVVDLLIVGAGPGGLACALRARERGLDFVTIEQADCLGGTVAAYPRRKLVMTQPVDLPLHGRLPRLTYQKEELIEVWERVAGAHDLPIQSGVRLLQVRPDSPTEFSVETSAGIFRARNVCLALGRRGTPRKLGVSGEDLPKVAYSLLDTESYQGRRILVVGGGDSAVEAALGLAEQPGNTVTMSYRKSAFFRLKARNEARVERAIAEGRIVALFDSQVETIEPEHIRLRVGSNGTVAETVLPNDEVFIFAGGTPPFPLLEQAGVSFNPEDRPPPSVVAEKETGLLVALGLLGVSAAAMLAWALAYGGYYGLPASARAASPQHDLLRPSGPFGLTFGLMACALFLCNLAYLVRRSPRWGRHLPGTLKHWMDAHVFTGLFGFMCVLVHAGFAARDSAGGHAVLALLIVIVSGTLGRYFYAFVPRAANGTENSLDELRAQLSTLSAEWDSAGRKFGAGVRTHVEELLSAGRWCPGLLARIFAMVRGQIRLRRHMRDLRAEARRDGIPETDVRQLVALARRAYRLSLLVTHYEEVRGVLSSWRYFHRWLAVLLVLLVAIHIATAARYAHLQWDALRSLVPW